MFITDLERRAARQLGLEKPWLYDSKPLAECPVCRSCGVILDREKAAQYGLVAAETSARTPLQIASRAQSNPSASMVLSSHSYGYRDA